MNTITRTTERIRTFRDIPDVTQMTPEAIEYLIDGLIPKRTVVLLAGTDGCGKSH